MKLKETVPNTELKLMLDSEQVLNQDAPRNEFKSLFHFDKPEPIDIWYLDTPDQRLRQQDWSVRYRRHEEAGETDLTIKKRYSEKDYMAMLESELEPLFAQDFTPEIDQTYTKKTYSLSFVRIFKEDIALDELQAKRLAIINSPAVLTDWQGQNAGFEMLCASKLLGPVQASQFKGTFEGYEAKLEIWPLKKTICELSFDVPTKKSAELKRSVLKLFTDTSIVLESDMLKTDLLLDQYARRRRS